MIVHKAAISKNTQEMKIIPYTSRK